MLWWLTSNIYRRRKGAALRDDSMAPGRMRSRAFRANRHFRSMPPPKRPRHSRYARADVDRAHMRLRRRLFDAVLEICARDSLRADNLAHMCVTSRARMHSLLAGRIELFNSETLVDILWRLGADVEIGITGAHPYRFSVVARPRPGWRPIPGTRE